ncbi:MAG: choice-of-anchor Q domain-containing protein [Verrucomicrobiota bacterium]
MKTSPFQILPLLALVPLAASAATVTTFTDEDNGSLVGGTGISLREAVKYSDAGSTIDFSTKLSGRTIRLTLGEIVIDRPLTIDGSALATRITLSGDRTGNGRTQDDTRILRIVDQAVTLRSLILSGASSYSDSNGGGTITASGHSLQLTVDRCTFSGNRFISHGAAIYFYGAYQTTPATKLTIRDSTFSGNTSAGDGGAIYAFGALEIQNTTLTGNKAHYGGGIYIEKETPALIQHTTISGNTDTYGKSGGIYNAGTLTLWNTLVTGNAAPGIYTYGGIAGSFTGYGNLTSGNPRLAPLGDYGGRTHTMPPLPGSPAIDQANANYRLPLDQRAYQRGVPDIGATEYQGTPDLTRYWKLDFDSDGTPYGIEQALGTDPLLSDAASPRRLTGPTLGPAGHPVLTFGLAPVTRTHWVLKRSPDLTPGSFQEIYRYDGKSDTAAPGITHLRTPAGVTVTDTAPPPGGAFYRLEVPLVP